MPVWSGCEGWGGEVGLEEAVLTVFKGIFVFLQHSVQGLEHRWLQ